MPFSSFNLLAAGHSQPASASAPPDIVDRPSPNHGPRSAGASVRLIVLHYTGMTNGAAAVARLCDPNSGVSAHYTIDEDGTLYRHVAEERRAWHAGVSWWYGETDINSWSIGIELVNPGHEFGYRRFPEAQMAVAMALIRSALDRYRLKANAVIGHSDVAPGRRSDPGELFAWPRLGRAGLGLWPGFDEGRRDQPEPDGRAEDGGGPAREGGGLDEDAMLALPLLALAGYQTRGIALPTVVTAFQRHYYPLAILSGQAGLATQETLRRLRLVATASANPFF